MSALLACDPTIRILYVHPASPGSADIRFLDTPRLHRQRRGRRRTVRVMDMTELADRFGLPADTDAAVVESALQRAGWPYHRDAAGRLWSVEPEDIRP